VGHPAVGERRTDRIPRAAEPYHPRTEPMPMSTPTPPNAVTLTPIECRVLGTLIEKALTVPGQYPLTLNSMVNGCNQRSNREPVTDLDEDMVLTAIDGLRAKGFAREVSMEGSRVAKFRHVAREALEIGAAELAVLTELLLRGPQTVGELRGRASRMHPLESLEVVQAVLDSLRSRPAPLVKRLPPAPGSRAERFCQLLCPELHPESVAGAAAAPARGESSARQHQGGAADVIERLREAELAIAELRERLDRLERALGS